MKNRTDNDIKNKWYSMMRSKEKKDLSGRGKHLQPPAEGSIDAEQLEEINNIQENISYHELEQMSSGASDKILPHYVPQASNYWNTNNPFDGQNVATYANPYALAGGQGVLVLLPKSTASQYLASTYSASAVAGSPFLGPNGVHASDFAAAMTPCDLGHTTFTANDFAGNPHHSSRIASTGMGAESSGVVEPSLEAATSSKSREDTSSNFDEISAISTDTEKPTSAGFTMV